MKSVITQSIIEAIMIIIEQFCPKTYTLFQALSGIPSSLRFSENLFQPVYERKWKGTSMTTRSRPGSRRR